MQKMVKNGGLNVGRRVYTYIYIHIIYISYIYICVYTIIYIYVYTYRCILRVNPLKIKSLTILFKQAIGVSRAACQVEHPHPMVRYVKFLRNTMVAGCCLMLGEGIAIITYMYIYIYPCIYVSMYLSIYLCIYVSIYLSIYLSISLSLCACMCVPHMFINLPKSHSAIYVLILMAETRHTDGAFSYRLHQARVKHGGPAG